jgi:hypothetical protein
LDILGVVAFSIVLESVDCAFNVTGMVRTKRLSLLKPLKHFVNFIPVPGALDGFFKTQIRIFQW